MRLAWKAQSRTNTTDASKEIPREDKYQIYFTCKPCLHRSGHQISKHGYHRGSVLITCPNCSVRHVITDHMKIFLDAGGDLESILRDKGEKIRRGSVAENGDIEMWDDHSTMRRPRLPELTDTESNNHVNMRKPQVPPRMPEGNESN
ncbi:MAG: hypothetical protein M1814_005587 [Vezdaea aestivalis]|nr:MAG: hypothetical protein M1814_005587 [Vezdaea aestivalis]